ncbi:MAG: histidinol-phosphate transaminase [Elusimicrobia bacterium]|nr:histidinol-phosphate transaminase [Elusimicrobiota bacterium]
MKINIQGLVRPEIRTLEPYFVPEVSYDLKLDAMENPYDLPGDLKKKVLQRIKQISFNRYPDARGMALRKAIAGYLKVAPEEVLLGNGSDELILAILLTFGGWGKRIAYPVPTFAVYGLLAQITGGLKREVFLEEDFQLNVRKILKEYPDVIFIANPNNPTGNCFNQDEILEIAEKSRGMIVIDEAYFEFSNRTFISQIANFENIIVLRTLSKAFGLAGLRVGYMASSSEVIQEVAKVKLPYNVNALSQAAAEIMVKNNKRINQTVNIIKAERAALMEELKKIVTPYPSDTNFILFSCSQAQKLYNYLLKKKILIKAFNESYLRDYLRVTVGTPPENKRFLTEVKNFMRGKK